MFAYGIVDQDVWGGGCVWGGTYCVQTEHRDEIYESIFI